MERLLPDPPSIRQAIAEGDGAGVHVAVIDSGVWFGDPRLASADRGQSYSYVKPKASRETAKDDAKQHDSLGHGTDVAAIIHHYAPRVRLSSYRVFAGRPEGKFHLICQAIADAVADGCRVINCSVGTRPSGAFAENDHVRLMAYKQCLDEAFLAGAHVVAAGSNLRLSLEEWPAFFTSVIGVRSVGDAPPFSLTYHPRHMISFGARGESAIDRAGEENLRMGASYAAARVTGLLARLLSVHPTLTPALAAEALAIAAR